jgi:hypothetical protein
MRFILSAIACVATIGTIAQKKPIDIEAARNWQRVKNPIVSDDRQYLAYESNDSTLVIYNLQNNQQQQLNIPNPLHYLGSSFQGNNINIKTMIFRPKPPVPKKEGVEVDLWSKNDSILQSAQLYQASAPDTLILESHYDVASQKLTPGDSLPWNNTTETATLNVINLKKKLNKKLFAQYPSQTPTVFAQLNKKQYLLFEQSKTGINNIYLTNQFKDFKDLTNVHPDKTYNWFTVDTFAINTYEDTPTIAKMYKPESFDTASKYPVIITLVDPKEKDKPATQLLSDGKINIPYLASKGFVIVEMSWTIETGRPGPAMFDKTISTILKLRTYNWVDTASFGIQGYGDGAYFVNYIITQTPVFKAAQSSAGFTDLISHYGSIDGKGESMQPKYDTPNGFFAKTLWEDSIAYIDQSPIIHADDITTPLLMMHNKEDMITPFAQAIELFTGMRRLGKRCWMLQYDDQGHTLTDASIKEDFTIRTEQFYNHYLKRTGAPVWMTRGVPAKMKGIDTGLEIDTEIKTPPIGGLLISSN